MKTGFRLGGEAWVSFLTLFTPGLRGRLHSFARRGCRRIRFKRRNCYDGSEAVARPLQGSQPILRVENIEASLRFYVGVLGFTNAPWGNDE
jgi:hypothetical protein